jgi:TRAP-type C4-dicarboxylate transport system substrate-binding protein
MRRAWAIAVLCLTASVSHADRTVLRVATVAPDGTLWARELKSFAAEIAAQTGDAVRVKWIFGGIAGDEAQLEDRVRRGQIDGFASGGPLCSKLSPTLRLFASPGLFLDRAESSYVLTRIYGKAGEEFAQAGYILLGAAGVGPMMVFSRRPLRSMNDLRHQRLWVWADDHWFTDQWRSLGVALDTSPIYDVSRGYAAGRIDALIATPTAALAFQWTTMTPFLSELRIGYLNGCVLLASRAFDSLPHETQLVLRSAAAKLNRRFEDAGRAQDDALLNGLLARQGVRITPVDATFRSDFFEAARTMRDHLAAAVMPSAMLARVQTLLADYRAEHSTR